MVAARVWLILACVREEKVMHSSYVKLELNARWRTADVHGSQLLVVCIVLSVVVS